MSDISLTLVLQFKTSKIINDVALEGGHASSAMMKVRKRSPRAAGLRIFLCEHVVLSVAVHLVTKDKLIRTIQTRHLQ